MLNREKAEATVRHVVALLAAGDYSALGRLSDGGPSANELRQSVEDYGQTIVAEPFEASEPEPLDDGSGWWTDVDLYTTGGQRGDLTLSLLLREASEPLYQTQVQDLHVL